MTSIERSNPIQVRDTGIIDITSLSSEGQGVGRADGLAVFVDGAIPGDRVEIEITRKASSYAVGKITKLINASQDRIKAPCSSAKRCGGCSLQHMNYKGQCEWKQNSILEAMVRIGGFDREILDSISSPIIGMEKPIHYRNKVQLPIAGATGKPEIGFFEINSHKVVDATECMVQHPVGDAVRSVIRGFIVQHGISIYQEKTGIGLMRHLVVRVGVRTGQVMVVLVVTAKSIPFIDELTTLLKKAAIDAGMELASFYLNIHDKKTNLVMGDRFQLVYGKKYIEEILCGIRYQISPASFFQVNTLQAEKLYDKVVEFGAMKPEDVLFDLYCGTGSISLVLAKHCAKVIGIEVVDQAIEDAKENARINNISNAEFHVGKAEELFPQWAEEGIHPETVVVDPPRKGLDNALLESIVKVSPPRIVYVSCNPATLARDCRFLAEQGGYKIKALQPVDLFPWTGHVETVVLMSRKDK